MVLFSNFTPNCWLNNGESARRREDTEASPLSNWNIIWIYTAVAVEREKKESEKETSWNANNVCFQRVSHTFCSCIYCPPKKCLPGRKHAPPRSIPSKEILSVRLKTKIPFQTLLADVIIEAWVDDMWWWSSIEFAPVEFWMRVLVWSHTCTQLSLFICGIIRNCHQISWKGSPTSIHTHLLLLDNTFVALFCCLSLSMLFSLFFCVCVDSGRERKDVMINNESWLYTGINELNFFLSIF